MRLCKRLLHSAGIRARSGRSIENELEFARRKDVEALVNASVRDGGIPGADHRRRVVSGDETVSDLASAAPNVVLF